MSDTCDWIEVGLFRRGPSRCRAHSTHYTAVIRVTAATWSKGLHAHYLFLYDDFFNLKMQALGGFV